MRRISTGTTAVALVALMAGAASLEAQGVPLPLEELPLAYRNAAWPLDHARTASTERRSEICEALLVGVREADAVGGGIDLSEELAFFDALALLERDAQQLAVHATFHRDGVERRNGANGLQMNGQIADFRGDGSHRNAERIFGAGPRGLRVARAFGLRTEAEMPYGHGNTNDHNTIKKPTCARTRTRRIGHRPL